MSKQSTKSYTVQVEDRIFRYARINVKATSAAEAALIARRLAYNGTVRMLYQAHDREPSIYFVEGVLSLHDMQGVRPNDDCLCDHLRTLLAEEGLDDEVLEGLLDEYGEDADAGCHHG